MKKRSIDFSLLSAALLALSWSARAQTLLFDDIAGSGFQSTLGFSVDFVGDLNGDGIDEIVAGSPNSGPAGVFPGSATVFDGATRSVLFHWDGLDGYHMGSSVAGPGDVNGDGTPDVLVGSRRANNSAGQAVLYSGVDGSPIYTMDGSQPFENLGFSVAGLGDVDGDDFLDFAVSGIGESTATSVVQVYSGRTGSVHWQSHGGTQRFFGYEITGLGDIDGDELGDLIVGAAGVSGQVGEVFVLSGFDGSTLFHYMGTTSSRIGRSVAAAGDVDQDGTPDFLLGALGNNMMGVYPSVRLHSGADGSLIEEWFSIGYFNDYGREIQGAGDQTGDGVPDLLISQAGATGTPTKLWLISGATLEVALEIEGELGFGFGVATNGNLNGYGATDVLISDPLDGIFPEPGIVYGYSLGCSETFATPYCTTSPNSVGSGAVMAQQGSSSVTANDLRLEAHGCPANQFGIFFYGAQEANVPFGDGVLCIASPVYRLPVVNTGTGAASWLLDVTSPLQADAEIRAGSRWNFQFWYRDPAFGGAGFNLSDGLHVDFCP